MLTTADGTILNLMLDFVDGFTLVLTPQIFSYDDTVVDPQLQAGTATAIESVGTVNYGIINASDTVVRTFNRDLWDVNDQ